MAKKSYTEVVTEILVGLGEMGVNIDFIKEDIKGINEHLKVQNGRLYKGEVKTERNSDRIGLIWKVGGWTTLVVFGGGGIATIILRILGVF